MQHIRKKNEPKHPGIEKNTKYREYAVKQGFTKEGHNSYEYGGSKLNICFYPCRHGVVLVHPDGSKDTLHHIKFNDFKKVVKDIIKKDA